MKSENTRVTFSIMLIIDLYHNSGIVVRELGSRSVHMRRPCFPLSIVFNRAGHAQWIVIINHKYMPVCNHKIVINLMLCLSNSAVVVTRYQTRRENISVG